MESATLAPTAHVTRAGQGNIATLKLLLLTNVSPIARTSSAALMDVVVRATFARDMKCAREMVSACAVLCARRTSAVTMDAAATVEFALVRRSLACVASAYALPIVPARRVVMMGAKVSVDPAMSWDQDTSASIMAATLLVIGMWTTPLSLPM